MKKNRMMRLASSLLVAVLLTTSVISGTFAKYVTEDSAQDSARVAKWGVAVSVNGNLFGTDYAANSASENKDSIVAATSQSVHSEGEENGIANIVAPGTKNETGLKIALTGTPEVAYTISATNNNIVAEEIFLAAGKWGVMVPAYGLNADTDFDNNTYYTKDGTNYIKVTNLIGFEADTDYYELIDEVDVTEKYYPMDWTVATSGAFDSITASVRLNDIQTEMIGELTQPNVSANTPTTGSYVLTWKWDFEDANTNNGADTILGNLMAANEKAVVVKTTDSYATCTSDLAVDTDYNLENKFGISVTVTQVD